MNYDELQRVLRKHSAFLAGKKSGERANLAGADLTHANLTHANLAGADLTHANLDDANLAGADLAHANLLHTIGNMRQIKSVFLETWPITYTSDVLQIGCQNHPISKWWDFADNRIACMDSEALGWWRKWKEPLKQIIELSPAKPTGAKKQEDAA